MNEAPIDTPAADTSAEGGAPPAADPAKAGSATEALMQAASEGKLGAVDKWLQSQGISDVAAAELVMLAQKDDRTRGKSPDELASMLKSDPALYEDLLEWREGGMLDQKLGQKLPERDEPTEDEAEDDYADVDPSGMSKSPMDEEDTMKAKKVMRGMGAKSAKDVGSLDARLNFMKRMAE